MKLQSLKTSFIIGTEFGAGMKLDVRDRGQLQRFQQFRESKTHIGAIHANSNAGDDEDEGQGYPEYADLQTTRSDPDFSSARNSSSIPDKDDDGSDPELSFDDIDDDEDMIEIEQALEGLVGFT